MKSWLSLLSLFLLCMIYLLLLPFLAALNVFSLSLVFNQFDYDMFRCDSLHVYPTWDWLNFLKVGVFLYLGNFQFLFFKYFFCPSLTLFFSGTIVIHIFDHLILSHRSLKLYSFFLSSFSLPGWIILIDWSST